MMPLFTCFSLNQLGAYSSPTDIMIGQLGAYSSPTDMEVAHFVHFIYYFVYRII